MQVLPLLVAYPSSNIVYVQQTRRAQPGRGSARHSCAGPRQSIAPAPSRQPCPC
jgi:hypothetical protein